LTVWTATPTPNGIQHFDLYQENFKFYIGIL